MFRGRYEHTIDGKGRLSIPSKFREVLKDEYDSRLVVTTLDGCLIAYPHQEWQALEVKISALPAFNKNTRSFLRNFYSSGVDCPIDKLGRILVPQALREYAGLTKDVMLLGIFKQFEIWDKGAWQARESETTLEDISRTLEDLGI
jgi:MraZ protein